MEPSDEELLELMSQQFRDDLATVSRLASYGTPVEPGIYRVSLNTGALDFARAVLARFGNQPAPPAEGEVAELVAALRSQAIDCTCDHLTSGDLRRAADLLEQHHPAPPTEGEVGELARWLRMQGKAQKPGPNSLLSDRTKKEHHAAGVKLTRAADLLEQRHPAPVPEEAANPWKDALIDALVCNFLLNKENESDPKKALHDLISWETRLAMDPSINPLMRPVPVSERLPGPEDCDGEVK